MNPQELLDFLLSGNQLSPDQLDTFITEHPREGQWHDYKKHASDSKTELQKQASKIPRWVTGFANAEGGVVFIGVDQDDSPPKARVTGCKNPVGAEPLDKWAQNTLARYVGLLTPPPRFQIVDHPDGAVLMIAIGRAPMLVPIVYKGRSTYFLRFNQSTEEAPSYLISDLVLRRRERPVLEIRDWQLTIEDSADKIDNYGHSVPVVFDVKLDFVIVNAGLTSATGVRIGALGFYLYTENVFDNSGGLNDHLSSLVDIGECPTQGQSHRSNWQVAHQLTPKPFDVERFMNKRSSLRRMAAFPNLASVDQTASIALYVSSADSPPDWYQLEVSYSQRRPSEERALLTRSSRIIGRRPLVSHEVIAQT